ncbi:hypothetical protein FLA_4070 [Filimonas lacunae]|nr:hypothetical protein FLA_4070 [Filimonas lacunae]
MLKSCVKKIACTVIIPLNMGCPALSIGEGLFIDEIWFFILICCFYTFK